jgi:DNA-binding transcriptional LysR family regulator
MLETRFLGYFIALAEELHFGRTAEQLGLAQSALSTHIQRLEDRLGTRLLERGRRSNVRLTRAGQTFLAEARLVVAQAARAEQIGRMAGRGEAGPAHIGYVFSAALGGTLVAAFRAIRAELPELIVTIDQMDTPQQLAALEDGTLDIGFIRPRPTYPVSVETLVVHRDPLLIGLASSHPLAKQTQISLASLASETLIFPQFGDGGDFDTTIDRLSARGGFPNSSVLKTRDFVSAMILVAAEQGVLVAPQVMTNITVGKIVFRRIEEFQEEAELVMAWRRDTNKALVRVIRQQLHLQDQNV